MTQERVLLYLPLAVAVTVLIFSVFRPVPAVAATVLIFSVCRPVLVWPLTYQPRCRRNRHLYEVRVLGSLCQQQPLRHLELEPLSALVGMKTDNRRALGNIEAGDHQNWVGWILRLGGKKSRRHSLTRCRRMNDKSKEEELQWRMKQPSLRINKNISASTARLQMRAQQARKRCSIWKMRQRLE